MCAGNTACRQNASPPDFAARCQAASMPDAQVGTATSVDIDILYATVGLPGVAGTGLLIAGVTLTKHMKCSPLPDVLRIHACARTLQTFYKPCIVCASKRGAHRTHAHGSVRHT